MPKHTVVVTGEKGFKTKKGQWCVEGKRKTGYGFKHVLLGLNAEPKQGQELEIEGDIFPMEQDALWEKKA